MWASSALALRQEPGQARQEAREPVARDAERMLEDRHLRSRQTAVSILGKVGDGQSVQALEALRVEEMQVESLQERFEKLTTAS